MMKVHGVVAMEEQQEVEGDGQHCGDDSQLSLREEAQALSFYLSAV